MKQDLDRFMEEKDIDAIWVTGATMNNPDMVYFTGIHHVSYADMLKIRGEEPVLFHTSMEREEAARSGLRTISYSDDYPLSSYYKKSNGNALQAYAMLYTDILTDFGLAEKNISVAGKVELNDRFALLQELQQRLPKAHLSGSFNDSIIHKARLTKSPEEVEHIRQMGKVTTTVVGNVLDLLSTSTVKNKTLLNKDGTPITVGQVKSLIRMWLAKEGSDNPEETIFSIGRDAGVPHNAGNPDSPLELGKTIIFDIFPCETGGGYFYDFTRTWSLGYASDEAQKMYEDVYKVHQTIYKSLKVNAPFKDYQEQTCKLFSEMGYATVMDDPSLTEGYVHSLGHGLGLDVHENPFSGMSAGPRDILHPGVVFTIEPGLYYPSKGMGVRIEDTVYMNEEGKAEILADFPYELVIPVKE